LGLKSSGLTFLIVARSPIIYLLYYVKKGKRLAESVKCHPKCHIIVHGSIYTKIRIKRSIIATSLKKNIVPELPVESRFNTKDTIGRSWMVEKKECCGRDQFWKLRLNKITT